MPACLMSASVAVAYTCFRLPVQLLMHSMMCILTFFLDHHVFTN